MKRARLFVMMGLTILCAGKLPAQRFYAPHSALANGTWYKIGVKQEGVYKIDVAFLTALGINTSGLTSSSIRLYGNGGGMLPENNGGTRADDLVENAIEVVDGGDGIFNGSDYLVFYAPGPDRWLKDSVNSRFRHVKNLYADTAYYFITIGGTGKRIAAAPLPSSPPGITVNTFQDRYAYENNLVSLMNSGKEWYGETFDNNTGGILTRNFQVDWPGLITTQPVTLISDLAARSIGSPAAMAVKMNSQLVQNLNFPAVSGSILDPFATSQSGVNTFPVTQSTMTVSFTYSPVAAGAQAWLNWFELHGRRALAMNGNTTLLFRDWQTVSSGSSVNFSLTAPNPEVWEITDPLAPRKMITSGTGNTWQFAGDASRLREYAAFVNAGLLVPFSVGKQSNQDLHGGSSATLLIITQNDLLSEAQRLAAWHQQQDNYATLVVTADQVYQEFSGGTPDPSAIRDFVKMYYDRAGSDSLKRPKYLLLFGSGSYDYRNRVSGNVNLVPVFESSNSIDPLSSYTSDDFFGLLEDTEDINQLSATATLDIGVGRIPARTIAEAKTMVDKIIRYRDVAGFGAWRNQSVFVADDQDQDLHVTDAESVAATAAATDPLLNAYKIYLDAYPAVSNSSGVRYPAVNDAIVNQVFNGTLIFNYSGHGSYQRLAEEAVLTQTELNRFNNPDKLPLFITASCDFAPHDDPAKNSLGSGILTGSVNGAIALLSTTRLVFAYSNRLINDSYLKTALTPVNGKYLTLGESVRAAKNSTAQNAGDPLNNRKFTLLGDPALRLAFPSLNISIDSLNGALLSGNDTLHPLGKYSFAGKVGNAQGGVASDFTGNLQISVFDKAQTVKTLGNDPASPVMAFTQQAGILYKGNATVTNGRFSFSFIVPKDITYQAGKSRISLYAANTNTDAGGVYTDLYIGGSPAAAKDTSGPLIRPFLNDDKFLDGGLTNENPVLLVKFFDSSGISTSGNGIGHDITAVIDGNEKDILVLNNFYAASQDSYQRGQVLFQLPEQAEGLHTIKIKAWDVANNSSEASLRYEVRKQNQLQVTRLRNFPNPVTSTTTFSFEHNQPGKDLDVSITIYDALGRTVRQLHQVLNTGGSRNCQINWAGDTQSGAKLTKGIYIYHVVVTAGGAKTESTAQLILF